MCIAIANDCNHSLAMCILILQHHAVLSEYKLTDPACFHGNYMTEAYYNYCDLTRSQYMPGSLNG